MNEISKVGGKPNWNQQKQMSIFVFQMTDITTLGERKVATSGNFGALYFGDTYNTLLLTIVTMLVQ